MKRKLLNRLFILCITITALVISCKKGDTGPVGPQSTAGIIGATGADGTKVYSGTGGPDATLGKTGDFYLNLDNGDFYGPKTSTTWGNAINLNGTPGATGATGAALPPFIVAVLPLLQIWGLMVIII